MAELKEVLKIGTEAELNRGAVDIVDTRKEDPLPHGVETWMREVEKAHQNSNTNVVKDDSTGQIVMQPTAPSNPVVTLPTTKTKFKNGFTKKVGDAGRWLSEMVLRLIKIKVKDNVVVQFKNES